MTYKKLYEDALFKLEHNKITLGEFEEMTKPLDREVEQEPTTKNDLGVDCISRQFIYELGATCIATRNENGKLIALGAIEELPSVTPQEPQTFRWCTDCREYDQEKHCCHRWSKVIRNTVEEMKQEYIEREVLDKLRAEITTLQNRCYALTKGTMCAFCKYECEYKAESEPQESEDKCKNCKYYLNPDYTRCHECKAESEVDNG